MSMNAPVGVIPSWTLSDRLVKARQVARLTQAQLATALGVGEKTVKRYEAGEPAKRGALIAWAFICGVDVNWLLGISPDDPPDKGRHQSAWHGVVTQRCYDNRRILVPIAA